VWGRLGRVPIPHRDPSRFRQGARALLRFWQIELPIAVRSESRAVRKAILVTRQRISHPNRLHRWRPPRGKLCCGNAVDARRRFSRAASQRKLIADVTKR
jgi:hypothetical protein